MDLNLRADGSGEPEYTYEYYGAAEPPVRTNGTTPFCLLSYFAIPGQRTDLQGMVPGTSNSCLHNDLLEPQVARYGE